jgi:hypothetical protein
MFILASNAICSDVTSVTFDQPLFWKALCIITNENTESDLKQIVLHLGRFHTEMSFLGSIGRLMAGSGLHEVLETAYASNAVNHMLSGKAVSRAVRGFMMVDNALHILLMKESFGVSLPHTHESDITEADTSVCRFSKKIMTSSHKIRQHFLYRSQVKLPISSSFRYQKSA